MGKHSNDWGVIIQGQTSFRGIRDPDPLEIFLYHAPPLRQTGSLLPFLVLAARLGVGSEIRVRRFASFSLQTGVPDLATTL